MIRPGIFTTSPRQPGRTNGTGALMIVAEKIGADTMLSRIVHMVAEAQHSRAPIQRLVDVGAVWFVPAVVVAAILAIAAWMIWAPAPALGLAMVAAVSVLIIACPIKVNMLGERFKTDTQAR